MDKSTNISTTNKFFNLPVFFTILLTIFCGQVNDANAASNGKLGTQFSASVEISVTIKQTFNTINPAKLILDTPQSKATQSPFCIAHHGFSNQTSVPYQLVVEDFKSNTNQPNALPFNVYLENKFSSKGKQKLQKGVSIFQQSQLNINKDMQQSCEESGLNLSIEKKSAKSNTHEDQNSVGLLILLVSPH